MLNSPEFSDATGGIGASITSKLAVPARIISLARNASSILRASAAVRVFLGPKIRIAEFVTSSAEAMSLSSVNSCSRNAADAYGPRIGCLVARPCLASLRAEGACLAFNRLFVLAGRATIPMFWGVGALR